MKTLVIDAKYPLPEDSGNRIRTMNFVRYFARLGEVDLIHYHSDSCPVDDNNPFGKVFHVAIGESTPCDSRLYTLYERARYKKNWAVDDFSRRSVADVVGIIERGNYDVILCRYCVNAFPLLFLPSDGYTEKIVIDIDDVMHLELYSGLKGRRDVQMPLVQRIKALADFKLSRMYQAKCAGLARTLVCSEGDRDKLGSQAKADNVFVVPNVAPRLTLPPGYARSGFGKLQTLLFVGNLEYLPNVQGIEWFVNEIFTKAIDSGMKLKLLIAGKAPVAKVLAMGEGSPHIEVIPNPPDLIPLYDRCGVVVVPLLAGGGTRIKILEAGLALRPIITTRVGAYGLNVTDRESILYMSDYESFVESYRWLGEGVNYADMAANMMTEVLRNYSVDAFNDTLDRVFAENRLQQTVGQMG